MNSIRIRMSLKLSHMRESPQYGQPSNIKWEEFHSKILWEREINHKKVPPMYGKIGSNATT